MAKIAKSSLKEHQDTEFLLETVSNLGFTTNTQLSHNLCLILMKIMDEDTVLLFEEEKHKNQLDLLILLIQYWLNDIANMDSFILSSTVNLISTLISTPKVWGILKSSPIVARLLSLQKVAAADQNTKSLIIKIVSHLSKSTAPERRQATVSRSKYQGVNVSISQVAQQPEAPMQANRMESHASQVENAYGSSWNAQKPPRSSHNVGYGSQSRPSS